MTDPPGTITSSCTYTSPAPMRSAIGWISSSLRLMRLKAYPITRPANPIGYIDGMSSTQSALWMEETQARKIIVTMANVSHSSHGMTEDSRSSAGDASPFFWKRSSQFACRIAYVPAAASAGAAPSDDCRSSSRFTM